MERFAFDRFFDELEAQMKNYIKSKGSWGGRLSPSTSGPGAGGEEGFGAIGKGIGFLQPSPSPPPELCPASL